MKCPKCGYTYCDIVSELKEKGSDYSICMGILGIILFGSLGNVCGWTNERDTNVEAYWVCKRCGYRFKA